METDTHKTNTRINTAFSLLALLLATSAFKEELRSVKLIIPPTDLLMVFTVATIFMAVLLVLYLIIDLKDGTYFEKKLNTKKLKVILDHIFLIFVILIIFFAISMIIISLLNFGVGYQSMITVLSSMVAGIMVSIRTIFDKRQYNKYLSTLSEEERLIKRRIASAKDYLYSINDRRLRADIESDIARLEDELKEASRREKINKTIPSK